MLNLKHKKNKGFTLIEVLVASTIFILVIGVTISVYITILKLQRSVVQSVQALDNARLAFEFMSRLIRTGTAISGPDGTAQSISFIDQKDRNVTFQYDGSNIVGQIGTNPPFPLISSDITVTRLVFIKSGTNPGNTLQPRVTILMQLKYTFNGKDEFTDLQTTISQRTLDSGPSVP